MDRYTTKSLAEKAGVSATYIRLLCATKKLKAEKVGRDWIIDREEGDRWLESRKK